MASGSSPLPSWQKALFNMPEEQRSESQMRLISILKHIDNTVPVLLDHGFRNPLDVKNLELIQALCRYVEIIALLGSRSCLEYYVPQKTLGKLKDCLLNICKVCHQKFELTPKPEILVPAMMSAFITLGYQLYWSLSSKGSKIEKRHSSLTLMEDCRRITLYTYLDSSILSKCDAYLKGTLGSHLRADTLVGMVGALSFSLKSAVCLGESPISRDAVKELVELAEFRFQSRLADPTPDYKSFESLFPLDEQFRILCRCYREINCFGTSHPLHREWWKAADIYIKLLKQALRQAKEAAPADPFSVAAINDMLLKSMLTGVSKSVSYAEIESLGNQLKAAVDACAWAPPLWKLEIESDLKIAIEVALPFLRKRNPSSYKTASIDVYSTNGYLDLYTRDAVDEHLRERDSKLFKVCDSCGIKTIGLLKCNACQSAWYCDKECQRKAWKKHKVVCKEKQRPHESV